MHRSPLGEWLPHFSSHVAPHSGLKDSTGIDIMHRRQFIRTLPIAVAAASSPDSFAAPPDPQVNTVLGERSPRALGMTLMHEHVLVDFVGADKVSPQRYNAEEVFQAALPHLKALRAAGCRTLVECTPAFLGRDPNLLKRLAGASGLHVVTNTGFLRRCKRQVRSGDCSPGNCRATGGSMDTRVSGRHRRHGHSSRHHQNWCGPGSPLRD